MNREEAVAILQHYGLPTPQIDLTGDIEIALFFALNEVKEGQQPSLFFVDTELLTGDVNLTEHSFLIDDITNSGLDNR